MTFTLAPLPFEMKALAPYISEETLQYHYGKHHQAYVNKLNELVQGTEFESLSLDELVLKAWEASRASSFGMPTAFAIFNNGAQHWNHQFYWHCLTPHQKTALPSELAAAIERDFGSFEDFKTRFTQTAMTHFGSGWTWLVRNPNGNLEVGSTSNANTPMTDGKVPLLTCDVWEHAYYIDARNNRAQYIENFWHLVNWQFVASR